MVIKYLRISKIILLMLIIIFLIKQKLNFIINITENTLWNLLNDIILKKSVEADDEKSIIKDDDLSIDIIPETSTEKTEKDKPLKDKLISDVTKTIVRALSGE